MGGAKMDFCDLSQRIGPALCHELLCSFLDARGISTIKTKVEFLALSIQPVNESFPRQDRCRRHRNIRFRLRALFDVDLSAAVQQRFIDHSREGFINWLDRKGKELAQIA